MQPLTLAALIVDWILLVVAAIMVAAGLALALPLIGICALVPICLIESDRKRCGQTRPIVIEMGATSLLILGCMGLTFLTAYGWIGQQ